MKLCGFIVALCVFFFAGLAFAGSTVGPRSHKDTVAPFGADKYALVFRGDEPAYIEVEGDGRSDLDCYAYDEGGNLVSHDNRTNDHCFVRWTPRKTGSFTLVIRNRSARPNNYRVFVN